MPSRSTFFALFLLSIVGTHSVANAQAPPPNADDLEMVPCRLAPRIRSIGGTTRSIPGRRVRTTKADCDARGGLDLVRTSIPLSLAGLHALRCGEARCYSSAEVAGAVERIREQVRQAIPPQGAALALTLDADLDRASELGEPLPLDPIQLVQSRPDNAASGYRTNAVANLFSKLEEVIDHVLSYDRLAPTLIIRSNPQLATFEMSVGAAAVTKLSGMTNTQLPHVWRGRYDFVARMTGRKGSQTRIDLMNGTPRRVSCELVPDSGSGMSFCKVEQ